MTTDAQFWSMPELEAPIAGWKDTALPRWPLRGFIPPPGLRLPLYEYEDAVDGVAVAPLTRKEAMAVRLAAREMQLGRLVPGGPTGARRAGCPPAPAAAWRGSRRRR